MSHIAQHLHEAFPDDADLLRRLKAEDQHFQALAKRFDDLDTHILHAEQGSEPADDVRLEKLKKERLGVLDEIAQLVGKARDAAPRTPGPDVSATPAADHAVLAQRLRARLAELADEIDEDESEVRAPLDADRNEQANEIEDIDTARGIEAVHRAEAEQVRAALQRIDTGSYGLCERCGGTIDARRLEAMPTATSCMACAARG